MQCAFQQNCKIPRLFLLVPMLAIAVLTACSGTTGASQAAGSSPSPAAPAVASVPSSAGTSQARFVYVGLAVNQGGLQGFRLDASSGMLSEVPASPLLFGGPVSDSFSQAGPLAVARGHVYVGFGPPGLQPPVIRSYAVDPATGALGAFTETDAGAVGQDKQMRALVSDAAGHNLYAVYQNGIASFQINADGSLHYLGTLTNLATAFIFSLSLHPSVDLAFLGVDNCPPKGNSCTGPPDILLLHRDPSTGALSNSNKQLGQNAVWSPGALAIDPSGKYLAAWTVDAQGASQISVLQIDVSSETLSPASGSTYPVSGGLSPVALAFDATGHFLYVLNSSEASPQPQNVSVYALDPTSGALGLLQERSLPEGAFAAGLLVDSASVLVFDSQAGTVPSAIYVLARDGNTGRISSPVFTETDRPAGLQAGLGQAAEVKF